ncbi:unnamed protein product, partial [Acanthocheilonema viteae]
MVEMDDVNVVMFDLDLHDDDDDDERSHSTAATAAISESGWYILLPINIMAK